MRELMKFPKLAVSFSRQLKHTNPANYVRDMLILLFKIRSYYYIDGWLEAPEAVALYRFAARLPDSSTIVEIGCWQGKSTYCLARGLRKGGRVVTIDPFDASGEEESTEIYRQRKGEKSLYDQFRWRMQELRVLSKIQTLRGFSQQFVGQVPKIDFLFVDGDHSIKGCEFDFVNYSPYLRSGGYLAFHDYNAEAKDFGPTWAVENRVMTSKEFKFVGLFHTLWVAQKV